MTTSPSSAFFVRVGLALGAATLLGSSALADGREPGSVLVHPYQSTGVDFYGKKSQFEVASPSSAIVVFDVVSVTNTNRVAATDVHFQYVNVTDTVSPFLFANCAIADRVETLTPADTLSVLVSCHNPEFDAEGYLVVSAMNPDEVDTYWAFDHLIGSSQLVTAAGGMYSLNALPFTSPLAEGTDTDLDGDGSRDFDGAEYEAVPDELYIDHFVGAMGDDLVLLAFTGGEYLVNVDFVIYNDDEFQLSAQYSFACWTRVPLALISGFFTQVGLASTLNDPGELDLDCDGSQDLETGWAIVRPTTAFSPTSANIDDPVVLGAMTNDFGTLRNARLLWESVATQTNGAFPAN